MVKNLLTALALLLLAIAIPFVGYCFEPWHAKPSGGGEAGLAIPDLH
jgi:hypothetical protein